MRAEPSEAVQALVAGVVEDPEHRVLDAGLPRGTGKRLELLARLFTQFEPFAVGGQLVGQFLATRLDGEVRLRLRDLRLSRIAVLRRLA